MLNGWDALPFWVSLSIMGLLGLLWCYDLWIHHQDKTSKKKEKHEKTMDAASQR